MPHRVDPSPERPPERYDPFDRFVTMWDELMTHRRITSDVTAFRFCSLVLTTARGAPKDVVAQSLVGMRTIRATAPAWNTVVPATALLLSAAMVKRGDDPAAFWPAVARTRELMRAARLPRNQAHEAVAAWVYRAMGTDETSDDDIARFAAVFRDMKGRQAWFTNALDYPLCAYLCAQPVPAESVAPRVEATYRALWKDCGLNRGQALQTAAQLISATGLEPGLAAQRAAALIAELGRRGQKTRPFRYDELAMMCFISLPVEHVAELIVDYHERAKGLRSNILDSVWLFPIAVSLCFLHTLGHEPALETLSDLKAMLDILAILAARQ